MRPFINPTAAGTYILVTGLAAGLAQVVLFRELLVVATGTELVIGLLLAVWLLGAAAGSHWAEQGAASPRAQARRAWKLAWATAPALAAGVLATRATRPLLALIPSAVAGHLSPDGSLAYLFGRVLAVQPGETLGLLHIVGVSLVATILPAFCCGAQFVTGARMLRPAAGAGKAYAIDALGHLLGGVALAFAATVWFDGLWVAAAMAPASLAAGWFLLPEPKAGAGRAGVVGALVLGLAMVTLSTPSQRWRWPQQRVLAERASVFGLVTIAEQEGGGAYLFENGVPSGASPPTPHNEVLVNFALLQVKQPRRVMLIGGGLSGGVAEALKHEPEHVDYVEFDPVFLELGRQWAGEQDRRALQDPRVRCLARDPKLVLRDGDGGYDAILMALPAPTTALLNRFFTREWFELCERALKSGGVAAFSLPYSQVYRSDLLARLDRCLYHTALGTADAVEAPILAGDEMTVVLPLGKPASTAAEWATTAEAVQERLEARGVDAPYLAAFAWDWLEPQNLAQARDMLSEPWGVNSDLRPVGYLLGTAYWLAQVTPTAGAALMPVLRGGPGTWALLPWALAAPMVIAALVVGAAPRRARRLGAWVLMASMGLAGMAVETALLLLMQSWHGYVYGLIGVVVGAFMVGVALGSVAAEVGSGRRAARGALALAYAAALGVVLYAWLRDAGPVPIWGFPLLALAPGSFVGFTFPLAVRTWGGGRGRGIGVIYAADLLGGVIAALIVPGLLVPLAGVLPSMVPVAGAALLFCAVAVNTRRRT